MQTGRYYYRWRIVGTVLGCVVVIFALWFGSWLVARGASVIGVFLMLLGIAPVVIAAIWGGGSVQKGDETEPPQELTKPPS